MAAMTVAGSQMANLCFNLAQKPGYVLTKRDCALMKRMQHDWDAARATEVAVPIKPTPEMIEGAYESHYGKRRVRSCGGAIGIDMTAGDHGFNGVTAFRRMWRGVLAAT